MAALLPSRHQWPKWLFLAAFAPLIVGTQYRRLQTWITLEELKTENEFLKGHLARASSLGRSPGGGWLGGWVRGRTRWGVLGMRPRYL